MNPFNQAWTLLKTSSFTKPSEVRAGGAEGSVGEFQPSTGMAWTHPSNIYDYFKTLYPFGKPKDTGDRLRNLVVGTDVHESMHEAMRSIGEKYDSGLHEEYAPNLAQNLVMARMPGLEGGKNHQLMRLIHGVDYRGIKPRPDTQAAMEVTREDAIKHGFSHPKVRKPMEGDNTQFRIQYGNRPKPEFYTGYGEDLE
jgi:hypothetical protein